MASDLQIQGEVVVNSEQAERAFDQVGGAAKQMANDVVKSSKGADDALNGMGDGANKNAEKFTRAESRISASIKRATNELELLGKTASQRLEFNIADKGLDAAKFEPALKKLREIEAQAMQAQRAATGSLDKMGISAAQTAAALRGVPAQFTDIVTSLQGGQAPLTVFLQQGGQLKDMFGGAGNAARALGGYVLGLVNPLTIAAAAAGALAFAYNQGSKEADAYNKALITTGNAAGTNAAQLKAYAQEISGIVGTQGKAAESLAALASTGKVGAESLRDAAKAAVEYERATGQAVGKTAEQFASLRNEPLAAVLKLNDGMNFLTDSTYKQIKSLEEQGRTAEAANVAQRAFADTLSSRAGEMERNLGSVERGWLKVKDAAKGAWDAILNVGRASTNADQLAEVRRKIAERENQIANAGFATNGGGAAFGRPSLGRTEQLRAELAGLQAQAAQLEGVANQTRVAAEEERKRGEAVKATAAFDKAGEKFLTDKAKMERELAAARIQGAEAGKSQAEVEQRLSEIRASYAKKGGSTVAAENKELREQERLFAQLNGVSSTYYTELATAQRERAKGVITEQQYVQAVEDLIAKQPFAVALAKEEAEATKLRVKAYEDAAKAEAKVLEQRQKSADTAQNQVQRLQDEEQAAAMAAAQNISLAQALEMLTLARLREEEAKLRSQGADGATLLALQQEIEAREKIVGLINTREARKASEDSAKDAAKEWERAAEDINRSLTDALLRGFESGKGFAENLRDTLKNMFKTLVLRPTISALMSPIAGAINGAVGGGAGSAGGGLMGGIQTASNLNTLWGAGSQALFGGSAGASAASLGYANAVGMAGGDSIGALIAANGGWAGVGVGAGSAALGGGTAAMGALGSGTFGMGIAAPAAAPLVTGAALNGSIMAGAVGTTSVAAPVVGGTVGGTAAAGTGLSGALAAIPVWGWALAAVAVLGTMLSKKQTLHSGAGAIYNSDTGVQEGASIYNLGTFGMGDVREYNKDGQALASGIAAGLGSTLDGVAKTFGQKAGYEVATAFADDTSKDGAWGSLIIKQMGDAVLDWRDTQTSKWAPKEFADGAEGQAQYLAEIAKDTRQVLLDMDLPSWADTMIESIGEAANMEQLSATLQQIGIIQAAFLELGKSIDGFAGMTDKAFEALMKASGGIESLSANVGTYYENFYSDAEKTAAVTRSVSESLAQVGLAMPATRDEFRALVESQLALGESGAEAAAALLGVSGAFASVTSAAQDAVAAEARAAESQYAEQMRQVADAANERQRITDGLLGERSDAEIELLRAQGKEEAALAAERARSIVGYDAYQVSLYDGTQAIFRQIEALQLAAEEMERMAEVSRTLAQELPGVLSKFLNPEQRLSAGYNSIASDLSKVGFKVDPGVLATASMQQIAAVTMELYNLGTTSDEVRLALVRAAGGLADLKAEATNLAVSRTDAAMSALERAAQAQREVLQETITDVRAVFDAAASGVKALRGQVDAAVQMSGAQGQAFIANALGNARTTGYLPDGKELQDAISAVTAGFDSAIFTTQADADYQRLVVAGNLEALQGIGGEQLTEAEKALDSLDAQLETAREQLDALRGIQGGVLSMADALAQFSTALARESAVRGGGGGAPAVTLPGYLQGANGASYDVKQDMGYQAGTGLPWMGADVRDAARQLLEAGNARGIYDGIKASGFSLAQADTILGLPAGEAEEWARSVGLPIFHDGTNYVPRTGFALLEQGEAVVPRAFNPSALGGGNTERLERLVEGLTTEVQRLQAVVAEGNGHQESTAKALGSVVVNNTLITAAAPEF